VGVTAKCEETQQRGGAKAAFHLAVIENRRVSRGTTNAAKMRMAASYYPTVDNDTCIGDKECYEVCPKSVFDWDEDNAKPIVARPDDCVEGCVECAKACPVEAITLPAA
jgi:NAD-dependent dihydropyrimidine dehydrogenase PreA subunit